MKLTGRKLAQAAAQDLRSFFHRVSGFKVKLELGKRNMTSPATFKTVGNKSLVCFSKDFCEEEVRDSIDFYYKLLMISHEFAHYLNQHNDHEDCESGNDSEVIEAWADFFGAKVMMTLITFGQKTLKLTQEMGYSKHGGEILNDIGEAYTDLVRYIYKDNVPGYPPRLVRLYIGASGITSFMDKYHGNTDIKRSISVMGRLFGSGIAGQLAERESLDIDGGEQNFMRRVNEIHKGIQKQKFFISEGMLPKYVNYLNTRYDKTSEFSRNYQIEMLSTVHGQLKDLKEKANGNGQTNHTYDHLLNGIGGKLKELELENEEN